MRVRFEVTVIAFLILGSYVWHQCKIIGSLSGIFQVSGDHDEIVREIQGWNYLSLIFYYYYYYYLLLLLLNVNGA